MAEGGPATGSDTAAIAALMESLSIAVSSAVTNTLHVGALAVEARDNDRNVTELLQELHHRDSFLQRAVTLEQKSLFMSRFYFEIGQMYVASITFLAQSPLLLSDKHMDEGYSNGGDGDGGRENERHYDYDGHYHTPDQASAFRQHPRPIHGLPGLLTGLIARSAYSPTARDLLTEILRRLMAMMVIALLLLSNRIRCLALLTQYELPEEDKDESKDRRKRP